MARRFVWLILVIPCFETSTVNADPPSSSDLIHALNQVTEIRKFQQQMTLMEFLQLIRNECRSNKAKIEFIVDEAAALRDNPKHPLLLETDVDLTDFYPFMKTRISDMLATVLARCPHQVTYLVRDGFIEITTRKNADTKSLLRRYVTAEFQKEHIVSALRKLSGQTGASIILDPNVSKDIPITASFRNDVSLEQALRSITRKVNLESVFLSSGIYVTTTKRAKALKK